MVINLFLFLPEPDVPDVETPGKDRELTLLGVLGLVKKKADSSSPGMSLSNCVH